MFKKLAVALIPLVVVSIALTAYFRVPKYNAEKRAREFCASLKPAESAKGIREKALAFGASDKFSHFSEGFYYDKEAGKYDKAFAATFVASAAQERHICSITIRNDDTEAIKRAGYVFVPTLY